MKILTVTCGEGRDQNWLGGDYKVCVSDGASHIILLESSVILSRSEHLTVRTSLDSELVKNFAPSRALLVCEKSRIGIVKYIYLKPSKKSFYYLNKYNQSHLIK